MDSSKGVADWADWAAALIMTSAPAPVRKFAELMRSSLADVRCYTLCITVCDLNGMLTRTESSVSAESIFNKPLNKRQLAVLERLAKRQQAGDDSHIDYSDIPRLSDEELAEFRRPAKKLVAVRLDADVLAWLRQYGEGYSTRINNILRAVMQRTGTISRDR